MIHTIQSVNDVVNQGLQFIGPVPPDARLVVANKTPIEVTLVRNDSWLKDLFTTWLSPLIGALLAGLVGLGMFCFQDRIQTKRQKEREAKDFRNKLSLLFTELTHFSQAIVQPEYFLFWGEIELSTWKSTRPLLSPYSDPENTNNLYGDEAQLVQIVDSIYLFSNKINTLISVYRQNSGQSYIEDKLKDLLSWSEVFKWQEQVVKCDQIIRGLLYPAPDTRELD